jgi:hypothetical protein
MWDLNQNSTLERLHSLPLDHLLVVGILAQLFHIQTQLFSNHKMICVGLEPQWYITQPIAFTTRPFFQN